MANGHIQILVLSLITYLIALCGHSACSVRRYTTTPVDENTGPTLLTKISELAQKNWFMRIIKPGWFEKRVVLAVS